MYASLCGSEVHLTLLIGFSEFGNFFGHYFAANAGTNKAASSGTSLNTRKLDEETENLSREFSMFVFHVRSLSAKAACFYSGIYVFSLSIRLGD